MSRLVLVTGGAGFIGSHLVDALLARGDRVRVLDDFSAGRRENLAGCLTDVELFEGDVRDPGLVACAVAGCDGVLHEAAVASVTQSVADPVRCDSVTHGGTVNLVRLARRAGVGGFVLASSCAVYGDTESLPIREDAPPRPLSPYALAKLLCEGACRAPARVAADGPSAAAESESGGTRLRAGTTPPRDPTLSAGMASVCLRYFNVYGPRQDPSSEYSGVIARFMDVAAGRVGRGTWPRYVLYGDGRQSRDFVSVFDVVAANLLALDWCLDGWAVAAPGGAADGAADRAVFNVGTGREVDVLAVAAEIERLRRASSSGADGVAEEEASAVEYRAPRRGDIRASRADITRARRLLGFEPAVSFSDGLAATYAWYAERGTTGVS